ncbi:Uncharacterised protein [Mycobacteroides abscessus]|nr:Uncharacterised protein [Mycobacteroides abscessus]SKS69133.1 Uncharacterised protein [Mycobacteroides abscessus subsp. abscessus]
MRTMRSNPRLVIALIAVGSILLIAGSIIGAVSQAGLYLVLAEGVVGIYGLGYVVYLYRKLGRSGHSGD